MEGISAETSLPPYVPQPTLPSAFHGRYSGGTESAILQSIFLGRRTGDIQGRRTHLFCIRPVVFPAWSPPTAAEDGTLLEGIARLAEKNAICSQQLQYVP